MKMHTCSSCGGAYWGNALVSQNAFTVQDDWWACVEVHANLNHRHGIGRRGRARSVEE